MLTQQELQATLVDGVVRSNYAGVETLTDLGSLCFHWIEQCESRLDVPLRTLVHAARSVYECARRCCPPGSKRPDWNRWAREAKEME